MDEEKESRSQAPFPRELTPKTPAFTPGNYWPWSQRRRTPGRHSGLPAARLVHALFGRPAVWLGLYFPSPVTTAAPALAVIDGSLCQLTREGARAHGHAPLATAVLEFRHGPLCYYVREHPHGFLPGICNLYCLDADFRLRWFAEWPEVSDPCVAILGEDGECLVVATQSGLHVRLDRHTGRLRAVEQPMAAAS